MREKRSRKRTVRYTLLLTPSEFNLANHIAEQDYRSLPEFFRMQIYRSATVLGINPRTFERPVAQNAAVSR